MVSAWWGGLQALDLSPGGAGDPKHPTHHPNLSLPSLLPSWSLHPGGEARVTARGMVGGVELA